MHETLFDRSDFVPKDVLDKSPFHYFTSLDASFRIKLFKSKAEELLDRLQENFKTSQLEDVYRNQWEKLLRRSKLA